MSTAQDVIDAVRALVNDEESSFNTALAWSDAEFLEWITDAQRQVVTLKPEANATTEIFVPEYLKPRQRLSAADASKLIRVEATTTLEPEDGVS